MTQEDLVKRSGVAIAQIRQYEANKSSPPRDVVTRLAMALGVSLDELAFDKATGVAASKLMDREFLEQFEMVSGLEEDERKAVKKIWEGVIVKYQFLLRKPGPGQGRSYPSPERRSLPEPRPMLP